MTAVPGFDTAVFPYTTDIPFLDGMGPAAALRAGIDPRGAHRRRVRRDRGARSGRGRLRGAGAPSAVCPDVAICRRRQPSMTTPRDEYEQRIARWTERRTASASARTSALQSPARGRRYRGTHRVAGVRPAARVAGLAARGRRGVRGAGRCARACPEPNRARASAPAASTNAACSASTAPGPGAGPTASRFLRSSLRAGSRSLRQRLAVPAAEHGAHRGRRRDAGGMDPDRRRRLTRSRRRHPAVAELAARRRFPRDARRARGRSARRPDERAEPLGAVWRRSARRSVRWPASQAAAR